MAEPAAEFAFEARRITKAFPGVKALQEASIRLRRSSG